MKPAETARAVAFDLLEMPIGAGSTALPSGSGDRSRSGIHSPRALSVAFFRRNGDHFALRVGSHLHPDQHAETAGGGG
jgi:hypothetical protein